MQSRLPLATAKKDEKKSIYLAATNYILAQFMRRATPSKDWAHVTKLISFCPLPDRVLWPVRSLRLGEVDAHVREGGWPGSASAGGIGGSLG
ncbi:uncharacterized protein GLRG_03130 [Colletotrichum graminicola M1.001]|uniref:Uncharacterized protein n=1 Tax=Colletotrichum graminicola (strain M1.001 / M2 / FGSC 10212) TaxID=645133 RepID=E3QAU8_COLGM|nr:uncharacterized protein GLRG_03130 [Colletotrichum graminicola M1.001]EFQ27986.1 hypothetical protein GLRG_03130 [Colletotrichum graminicola M1.001]